MYVIFFFFLCLMENGRLLTGRIGFRFSQVFFIYNDLNQKVLRGMRVVFTVNHVLNKSFSFSARGCTNNNHLRLTQRFRAAKADVTNCQYFCNSLNTRPRANIFHFQARNWTELKCWRPKQFYLMITVNIYRYSERV